MTMTEYEALKKLGHSAAKAAEIVLDAKRGDKYAKLWIDVAMQLLEKETRWKRNT